MLQYGNMAYFSRVLHEYLFSVYAVLVYLEKGGSTEKLLELECGGDLHRSEDTFKGRIKKLEEK